MPDVKIKDTFTVKVDSKDVLVCVVKPTAEQVKKAQLVYNETYGAAWGSKAPSRSAVEARDRQGDYWTEEDKKRANELEAFIKEGEVKLVKKGIKLSDAKKLALEIIKKRREFNRLNMARSDAYTNTAEAQAENARFNYLLSVCARYEPGGEHFFKNLDDLYDRVNDPAAIEISRRFQLLQYNVDNDYQKKLPENKFLIQWGYMNDKLQLLNEQRKPVDEEGRLIDEEGRFINEKGEYVDREGNRVDKEGNLLEEETSFLDEEGNPIGAPSQKVPSEEPEKGGSLAKVSQRRTPSPLSA